MAFSKNVSMVFNRTVWLKGAISGGGEGAEAAAMARAPRLCFPAPLSAHTSLFFERCEADEQP
jgi:hypothetical protein